MLWSQGLPPLLQSPQTIVLLHSSPFSWNPKHLLQAPLSFWILIFFSMSNFWNLGPQNHKLELGCSCPHPRGHGTCGYLSKAFGPGTGTGGLSKFAGINPKLTKMFESYAAPGVMVSSLLSSSISSSFDGSSELHKFLLVWLKVSWFPSL